MRNLHKTLAFLLPLVFHANHICADSPDQPSVTTQSIDALVKQIQSDKPLSQDCDKHALILSERVSRMNALIITDQDIDSISSLLQNSDDVVRFNAARALGYIGPKARRAVPALEVALKRVLAERAGISTWSGSTSQDEICPALKKITGRTPSPECQGLDSNGE
jgi:hypothetical protein